MNDEEKNNFHKRDSKEIIILGNDNNIIEGTLKMN